MAEQRDKEPANVCLDALGQSPTRCTVHCDALVVRRIAAMLDLDPAPFANGTLLPPGWHFALLGGETRRSNLRADGFPGLGVSMPDLGLPRLLLAGRTVEYRDALLVGEHVERLSRVHSVTHKQGASGPMAVVTIGHELRRMTGTSAILETQTYILLGAAISGAKTDKRPVTASTGYQTTIRPDETLLFQYSALGFNSHKIHIDRDWARNVEGLPDLVVNGGLATLLLMEFLRKDLKLVPVSVKAKHKTPLYCGRPITLTAYREEEIWRACAFDDLGTLAVDMEVNVR
jgi:3-methylfumaryl-CoA hydratase